MHHFDVFCLCSTDPFCGVGAQDGLNKKIEDPYVEAWSQIEETKVSLFFLDDKKFVIDKESHTKGRTET